MGKRVSPATAISFVALFFSLGGAGLAASRFVITSTSQIKPSVLASLRGARGPSGVAGAPGQQGARGDIGPQGPAGPQGAAGGPAAALVTIYVQGDPVAVPAGEVAVAVAAECPSGWAATGGGFHVEDGGVVTISEPLDASGFPTGWAANVTNPTAAPISARAWVVCAN